MPGIVTQILVEAGSQIVKGQDLIIIEAMKMENAIKAPSDGVISAIHIKMGDLLEQDEMLLTYREQEVEENKKEEVVEVSKDKAGLDELRERRYQLSDAARPAAVEKRRKKGRLTAREGVALLTKGGSFREYGSLIIAAQRSRRSEEDLIANTPADGLVAGVAEVDMGHSSTQAVVMAYDYTVLAGTQGTMNHMKMDRLIEVAHDKQLPIVLFAEGGGGRPGDVDLNTIAGLFISTFTRYAGLRDVVPTVSIVTGYCFAGNAALAGSSDLIIGTKDISIGMGGPAMIEGGGLGKFHPKDVGPADVQTANGVIDVLVDDDTAAIKVAQRYLGYYYDDHSGYKMHDQQLLQSIIPEQRKRTFDIKGLIETLCDQDSVLHIQDAYAPGMITCIGRISGKAIGIIANDSRHEAGAITADCARKAATMIDRCHRYGLPLLSLIDTPGIMVGPEGESQGTVKAAGELFVGGARLKTPLISVVVRRAYGLGAMAMMGGGAHRATATVAWPTAEFGAMGIEGAVQLGYRKELQSIEDPVKRKATYDQMVEETYRRGRAINAATIFEIDEVIEPRETRDWIVSLI